MAIEYFIYTDLSIDALTEKAAVAAAGSRGLWEDWWVRDDLGPFHEEIMEEYGVYQAFKSKMGSRHSKDHSIAARAKLMEFFEALPGRKLLLNGDELVDYRED